MTDRTVRVKLAALLSIGGLFFYLTNINPVLYILFMSDLTIVQNGKVRRLEDITMVDAFLKKVATKPMWEVIDFMIKAFVKRHPGSIEQKDTAGLKNRFAATKDLSMRNLISMPQALYDLIDRFYHDEIESNKKKFMYEFARRYKVFTPAEKI